MDIVLDEVLTPETLVDGEEIRILDPACGSGIFLTEAFRRLVYYRSVGRERAPTFASLSRMLSESIFGIDRNDDAVGVTAFGLYLALLEHVDPRTIWLTARLPELIGTNLVVSDFFEDNRLANIKFDVIVGNPPWQSRLSKASSEYLRRAGRVAPDKQIAVAFVWRATEMLTDTGFIGFVLPAKTILHNRVGPADRFRLEFFSKLDVHTVIDLSPLRKELFGAASSPAAIVIFSHDTRTPVSSDTLLHVSPRRTPISQIVDGIVIPQHNIQQISRSVAAQDPSIWKTLLWGNTDDVALVRHMRETFMSLTDTVERRKWHRGAGYQLVGGDENDASHLVDLPQIATADFRPMALPVKTSAPVTARVMHRPRDTEIYSGPHILMRKGFKDFPEASFIPFDAAFTDGLFAIAAGPDDKQLLQAIAGVLNSSVARYWFLMTASSWGVEREQLHYREWMSLPVPALHREDARALAEIVQNSLAGAPEESWRSRLDEIVERAYGLTEPERQLLRDALTIRWSELHQGWRSEAYSPPDNVHYARYAESLSHQLELLELGQWKCSMTERSAGFVMLTCENRESAISASQDDGAFSVTQLLGDISQTHNEWLSTATIIEPQAVVLDGVSVHLIKPDRLTCWPMSATKRDAADVFGALLTGDVEDRGRVDDA
ncbi:hypothetical protein N802_11070 [Knoellia sinensis KCTC 19936]|uniref:site-specific DNA-methyltransferase (adenine-specific) n=1 Tax=Knoellia sinensis KCTC 19936 TaxID=1385520 RepID=A0A0A0J4Q3_9MICO|nr:hypothetical protein N802_11070 [Knoellia sinensis KCTC 19936]